MEMKELEQRILSLRDLRRPTEAEPKTLPAMSISFSVLHSLGSESGSLYKLSTSVMQTCTQGLARLFIAFV